MIYDPKEAMKIMTLTEAAVYLGFTGHETIRKMANGIWSDDGDIFQAAFFKVNSEFRTTPHLQLLAQEEIFRRNMMMKAA